MLHYIKDLKTNRFAVLYSVLLDFGYCWLLSFLANHVSNSNVLFILEGNQVGNKCAAPEWKGQTYVIFPFQGIFTIII
ncbi:hypothetical protein OIU78_008238, partial [Salix suchowensis]